MSKKPFDYYAGYPGQQGTPKWVGVVLGSMFGGLLLITVGIGVRMLMPARSAQASVVIPAASPVAPQPILAAAPVAEETEVADAPAVPTQQKAGKHGHAHHDKKGGKATRVAVAKPGKPTAKYAKAQVFAKSVSRKDKKARDDIDKMLGL